MALKPINQVQAVDEGSGGIGGLAGQIAGGVIGAVGGSFTPAGPIGGFAAGSTLGGMAGSAADQPATVSGGGTQPQLMSAASQFPEVQMATLVDGKKALMGSTEFSQPQKQLLSSYYDNALKGMG